MGETGNELASSAGFRYEGRRVIVEDIERLENLSEKPALPEKGDIDHYVEAVDIEYYIPAESRFIVKRLYFYIPLVDPEPRKQDIILKKHIRSQSFFDLIQVIEKHPKHSQAIKTSYNTILELYQNISESIKITESEKNEKKGESYRKVFYLCESVAAYEPTLASLEILGDFLSWNLNYLIRTLNKLQFSFSASDRTTAYLIKRRNLKWEAEGLPYDENFTILAALFFEQAFPGRSLEEFRTEHLSL